MDKWPGGQSGGNPCHRQNLEKKNEKKRKWRHLWDNIKHTNIHIIGVPVGEEREKGSEKIFEEILAKNFPNMGKEIVNQVQEAQRVPGRINPRRNTLRHIAIKLTKIKDRDKILKATREKWQITCKGTLIKLSADFSTETLQARRKWHDIFKSDEREELPMKDITSGKLSLRSEREIIFPQ